MEAVAQAEDAGRRRLSSAVAFSKKLLKLWQSMHDLSEAIPVIFEAHQPTEIAFVLGSTIQSPKEVHVLQMGYPAGVPLETIPPPPAKTCMAAMRQLLRLWIQSGAPVFERELKATKVFVLIKAPRVEVPADGLLPKLHWSPPPGTKRRQPPHRVCVHGRGTPAAGAAAVVGGGPGGGSSGDGGGGGSGGGGWTREEGEATHVDKKAAYDDELARGGKTGEAKGEGMGEGKDEGKGAGKGGDPFGARSSSGVGGYGGGYGGGDGGGGGGGVDGGEHGGEEPEEPPIWYQWRAPLQGLKVRKRG